MRQRPDLPLRNSWAMVMMQGLLVALVTMPAAELLCSRYQADALLGLAFFPLALLTQSPFADAHIPILARMRRQSAAGVLSEETAEVSTLRLCKLVRGCVRRLSTFQPPLSHFQGANGCWPLHFAVLLAFVCRKLQQANKGSHGFCLLLLPSPSTKHQH